MPPTKNVLYHDRKTFDLFLIVVVSRISPCISHEEAGAILAEEILTDCGYTREERKFMTDTILRHRDMKEESESFASIFYRADKL